MIATSHDISVRSVLTTTIWASCVVIGLIGIVVPYARPATPKPAGIAIQAEILNVELTNDPLPPLENSSAPPPTILTPPPAAKPVVPPGAPALIRVAAPSPAIAFALPVSGPTRVVAAPQASYSTRSETPRAEKNAAELPVAPLTFGRGEGKQPAPTYPARALSEGQEGVVRVEFTVGADGRTVAAELAARSPWPLLNEAALKVIRERWRFAPGPVRRFEVPIHFKIQR
jgi:TonB family protein